MEAKQRVAGALDVVVADMSTQLAPSLASASDSADGGIVNAANGNRRVV